MKKSISAVQALAVRNRTLVVAPGSNISSLNLGRQDH